MTIDPGTRISKVIREDKRAIESLASLSPKFKRLRNPLLRKVMAPRVTIEEAARIGDVSVPRILEELQKLGFETVVTDDQERSMEHGKAERKREELLDVPPEKIRDLDVREDIENGKDPFQRIMENLEILPKGHVLRLINSFEPIPLFRVLQKKGFEWSVDKEGKDRVVTCIRRAEADKDVDKEDLLECSGHGESEKSVQELRSIFWENHLTIDVRGLEMPQPMVRILETLETIGPGEGLFVHHERVPQYLLPELEDKGYSYAIQEINDSYVQLFIFKCLPGRKVS